MLHKSEADLETSIENLSLFPNRFTDYSLILLRKSSAVLPISRRVKLCFYINP